MKRRILLAASVLPLLASLAGSPAARAQAALAPEDAAELHRLEQYLNGIRTLKARFLQIAPDGATIGGIAWMQRPGRMRFQYDKPSPLLLVAGHGLVVFHDAALNQTTNIPEGQTPLGLLLGPDIQFGGATTVTAFQRLPGQVQVTLQRAATPGDGTLTLVFSDQPLALVSWTVVDAQARQTTVRLFDVQYGGSFDQSLFTFIDPRFFGPSGSGLPGGGIPNGGGG